MPIQTEWQVEKDNIGKGKKMILKVKKVIYPKSPEPDYKGFVIMFALAIEKQEDIMVTLRANLKKINMAKHTM